VTAPAACTVLFKDITSGPRDLFARCLTTSRHSSIFGVHRMSCFYELWESTAQTPPLATHVLLNVWPCTLANQHSSRFLDLNGTLFFFAANTASGY